MDSIFLFVLININTFTKNPPANMKVITVTEARVVALFTSMSVAPMASPSPYSYKHKIN